MNMMGFIWLGFGKKSFCKNRISGGGVKNFEQFKPHFFFNPCLFKIDQKTSKFNQKFLRIK